MKGEAGMVTGVPPLPPKLLTRTLLGVLNAPSSVHVTGEAILSGKENLGHTINLGLICQSNTILMNILMKFGDFATRKSSLPLNDIDNAMRTF